YVEAGTSSGLDFRFRSSATSRKYLVETMGGGVAIFDYDNDGWPDVFFVNGASLKDPQPDGQPLDKSAPEFWNRLFHNNRDGTFTDASASSGIASARGKALGVAFWDFDNDGWLDVYVANDSAPQMLFRNNGNGTFTDVALAAGVAYTEDGKTFSGMGTI